MSTPQASVAPTGPEQSSPLRPAGQFRAWLLYIVDWIKAMSPAGATRYEETIAVTTNSDFSAPDDITLSRSGKMVTLEGSIKPKTGNFSNTAATVFTIPATHKPRGYRRLISASFGSATAGTLLATINTAGIVTIQTNGSATDVFYFCHTWKVA